MKKKIILRTGCSGYYNRAWKNSFYPGNMAPAEWLAFYCKHFNSLEINSTFYKFPTVRTLTNWYNKTPKGFVVSVKAPKIITHMQKFNNCDRYIADFYRACEQGLKEKMGCALFQLHPAIVYSDEKLEQIISCIKQGFKNVIEFRHASWWNKNVFDVLAESKIIFCSINHPALPQDFVATTPVFYARYHGNPKLYLSAYSDEDLRKLTTWLSKKQNLVEAYVYFNNTITPAAADNAKTLVKLMGA
jgi:uncharacterized protein YecE (DUF72 family)